MGLGLYLAERILCPLGFRDLGFRDLGFRDLGFRDVEFRDLGFRDLGFRDLGLMCFGLRDLGLRTHSSMGDPATPLYTFPQPSPLILLIWVFFAGP